MRSRFWRWWWWILWVGMLVVSLKGAWQYGGVMWRDVLRNEGKSREVAVLGKLHRADGMVVALERQLVSLPEGARVGVVRGEGQAEWRNIGALSGWFLPKGGRTEMFREGGKYDAVVGGMSGRGYPAGWFRKELSGGLCVAKPGGFWKGQSMVGLTPKQRGWAIVGWATGWCVCGVAGYLWLRRVWSEGVGGVEKLAMSLCLGALVVSGMDFFGLGASIEQPWRSVGVGGFSLVLSAIGGVWMGTLGEKVRERALPSAVRGDGMISVFLGISWLLVLVWGARIAFRAEPDCVPMLGHYGYKARVFFEEGLPKGFPGGQEWALHVPEYPIGVSLLGDTLFGWMRVFQAGDVRAFGSVLMLNQALCLGGMAVLLCGVLSRCFARGKWAGALVLALCFLPLWNGGFALYFREFYPETWMMWLGLVCLRLGGACSMPDRAKWIFGMFLFGAMCWIKADGLLWMGAACVVMILERSSWEKWTGWGLGLLVWFLPWKLWCMAQGVGMADFSVSERFVRSWSENWERFFLIGGECWRLSREFVWAYGAWWWFVCAGICAKFGNIGKLSRELRSLWFFGICYGMLLVSAYFFSSIELRWHMNGFMRLGSVLQIWSILVLGWMFEQRMRR